MSEPGRATTPPVLVIVPTYNERDNVRPLAAAVLGVDPPVEMLFVDDNSPDGTGGVLDALVATHTRVHVLHRPRKRGLGPAYLAGFRWALARGYDHVIEMDADFSHAPLDIPRLVGAARLADLVLGSRYVGGTRVINWAMARLLLSQAASLYVRRITGLPSTDPTSGFRCYRRTVLDALDLDRIDANGYAFQIEMAHRVWMLGFHLVDLPITFEERRAGHSKMTWGIVFEAIWRVWALLAGAGFRRRPRGRHPASVKAADR